MTGRVLHLLSQRPGWTGSGMGLHAVVQAAARRGWEQSILVGTPASDSSPGVGDLELDRIRALVFESDELPFPVPGMSDVMPYPSTRFAEMTSGQLSAYRAAWMREVAYAINDFRPDVIHSHHIWLLSSLIKDITQTVPVVTHCHGTGLRQLELCPRLAPQVRAGCARNDAFLLLHAGHADTVKRELGVSPERLSIIGSGFREDVFHDRGRPPSCGPVVTYAGKLSKAKGVPWLLEAIEGLKEKIPGLTLNVAGSGSGPEADAIRIRMEDAANVVFHGQLTPDQLAELLRRSAVFVLPSFYEGLPLVLIEAVACGCRLVATALPGVFDQLQPELGDVLETVQLPRLEKTDQPLPADLPTFVEHLTVAIEASLARGPQHSGRQRVTGMTWDSVFEKIERVWWGQMTSGA